MRSHQWVALVIGLLGTLDTRAQPLPTDAQSEEVRKIAVLDGQSQLEELDALLERSFRLERNEYSLAMFHYEGRLRPALRALLWDSEVAKDARWVLSLIGVAEDLRLIVQLAPPAQRRLFADRWAYGVACALLHPESEAEWAFLRNCALNAYDDRWVDAAAIQSLRLIASPQSQELLIVARDRNQSRRGLIERALAYVQSNPAALVGQNLDELAQRVAQAVKIGDWEGNSAPILNKEGDKALVNIQLHSGFDGLVYTATFHKVQGLWTLRGVRETLQMFAPPVPVKPRQ